MMRKLRQLKHFFWVTKETFRRADRSGLLGRGRGERLWNALKINVKDAINVQGVLDYPRHRIVMDASTYVLVGRLNACKKEPETVAWIEEIVKPGDTFYDIGASVGVYSFIAWGAVGGRCRVFSFEPSFASYATLCRNIYLNNSSDSIVALPIALSAKTALTSFHYSGLEPSRAKHFLGAENAPRQGTNYVFSTSVMSFQLDDVIRFFNLPLPNVMKIDVDGGELPLIRGAAETLRHPRLRSVQIEVDENIAGYDELFQLFTHAGFSQAARHQTTQRNIANYIFNRETERTINAL